MAAKITLILLSLLLYSQCQIISLANFLPTSPQTPSQSSTPIPPISQVYKGQISIQIPNSTPTQIEYYLSFTKHSSNCHHALCFYGWVSNYTVNGGDTVQGYPQGKGPVMPVFELGVNSKKDFVIKRDPGLGDEFGDIIEIGCQMFQPTIRDVSQVKGASNARLLIGNEEIQYTFQPEEIDAPQEPAPSSTFGSIKNFAPSGISGGIQSFAKMIPAISPTLPKTPKKIPTGLKSTTITKPLSLKDVTTQKSDLKQKITVDNKFTIVRRTKNISLNIPSDILVSQVQEQEKDKPDFISNVRVDFDRVGEDRGQSYEDIKKYVEGFNDGKNNFSFNAASIEAKRATLPESHKSTPVSTIQDQPPRLLQTEPLVIQSSVRNLAAIAPAATSLICPSTSSLNIKKNLFSYSKVLYQKTIFGKKVAVSIKIDAILNDNKIDFKGILTYDLFGSKKSITAFSYVKQFSLTWSKKYDLNGKWSFNFYIPLPPPVSFLGINFGFTVSYGVQVEIYAKGDAKITSCIYEFSVGANVGTGIGVDASATVRAVAIEGGVFIGGDLIKLSTDPKLSIAVNLKSKAVTTSVVWYFYVKAFSFDWGFFYRYWKLFSGWSGKKIIKKFNVSNGITKSYLIYKK